MANMKTFPSTFEEFIQENNWEDNTGAYNCKLIEVEDILNAWEYYTDKLKEINQNLNYIYYCLKIIKNNLYDIEEEVDAI